MQSVIYNTAVTGAILNRDPANSNNIFFNQVIISNNTNDSTAYSNATPGAY